MHNSFVVIRKLRGNITNKAKLSFEFWGQIWGSGLTYGYLLALMNYHQDIKSRNFQLTICVNLSPFVVEIRFLDVQSSGESRSADLGFATIQKW